MTTNGNIKTSGGFWNGLSIKFKIGLATIVLLAAAILSITVLLFNQEKTVLLNEMKDKGRLLVNNLAAAGFMTLVDNNRLVSSDVIAQTMRAAGVIEARILDSDGRVVDAEKDAEIGQSQVSSPQDRYGMELKTSTYRKAGHTILEASAPIVLEYKDKKIVKGYAVVGIDQSVIEKAISDASRSAGLLALVFLVLGAVISLLVAFSITRPLGVIISVMKKVGDGDLDQTVQVKVTDEIGRLAGTFNEMIRHLKEKMMMSKYISKSAQEMISHKEDHRLELGGTRKTVTLFFSDIRGFTAFSEKRTPEQVIDMLNKYLSVQAEIIDRNGGSIDKFVGDEVVGVFEGPDAPFQAVASAVEIQKTIAGLNKESKGVIAVGIGINTGEAVMGNMGSKDRMDYTVIGDSVNTAARFCSAAERDQILIADATYKIVKDKFSFEGSKEITVKNKSKPLTVHMVKVQ
jgi:class 3 adenylate cyclase